jgi:hypothetical protein
MDESPYIRKRLVCLKRSGDASQAAEACVALRGIKGVVDAHPVNHHRLQLTYSLEHLTFELIEELLKELGFYLDNSLFSYIRRNIYQYLEDTAREKIQVDEGKHSLMCQVDPQNLQDEPEKYWNNYR